MSKRGRGRGTATQKSVVAATTMQPASSEKQWSVVTSQKHGGMSLTLKHGSVAPSQKSTTGSAAVSHKPGSEELFMECVDEDLAPSQKEAGRRAESEYQTAVQRVQTATSAVNADVPNSQTAHESSVLPARRGRGRPPKSFTAVTTVASAGQSVTSVGRGGGRGRPTAVTTSAATATANAHPLVTPGGHGRGRGRGSSVTPGRGRGRGQPSRNTSAPPADSKLAAVVAVLVV